MDRIAFAAAILAGAVLVWLLIRWFERREVRRLIDQYLPALSAERGLRPSQRKMESIMLDEFFRQVRTRHQAAEMRDAIARNI